MPTAVLRHETDGLEEVGIWDNEQDEDNKRPWNDAEETNPMDDSWVIEDQDEDQDEQKEVIRSNAESQTRSDSIGPPEIQLVMPSSQSWISTSSSTPASPQRTGRARTSKTAARDVPVASDGIRNRGMRVSSQQGNRLSASTEDVDHRSVPQPISSGPQIDYGRLFWTKTVEFVSDINLSYLKDVSVYEGTRYLLSLLAGLWLFAALGSICFPALISSTITQTCHLPGVSQLRLPMCRLPAYDPNAKPQYDALMSVQSQFEDVLASSISTANLPLAMKHSESYIRDVRIVVENSELASKNELIFEFDLFVTNARQASVDLTRFNTHIGRTIDQVLNINRWTLRVIRDLASAPSTRSDPPSLLGRLLLFPFSTAQVTDHLLLQQYVKHTAAVEEQVQQLILTAQMLLGVLERLEGQLDLIHTLSTREGARVQSSHDELLARLWTKLGGHRASRQKNEEQLRVLSQVNIYRKTAYEHVSTTLVKLQAIAAGLEDLRERVAEPDVALDLQHVPLQVHVDLIQSSLERLAGQRFRGIAKQEVEDRQILDRDRPTGQARVEIEQSEGAKYPYSS